MTRVDPRVNTLAVFDVLLPGGESLQFGFQLQKDRLRKAVGEMKGDVLGHVGTFKVGEIAAAVPPGSAIRSANLPIGRGCATWERHSERQSPDWRFSLR